MGASDWVQAGKRQPEGFVKTVHEIEALHGLPRRSLHQVINGAQHHQSVGVRITFKADVAVVCACQQLGIRLAVDATAFLDEAHKRLVPVVLPEDFPHRFLFQRYLHKHMTGGKDAPHHFNRGRGKVDRHLT